MTMTSFTGGMAMISSDGLRAFRGVMKITPVNGKDAFFLEGDWVYRSESGCWYGCGRSFGENICTIYEQDLNGGE